MMMLEMTGFSRVGFSSGASGNGRTLSFGSAQFKREIQQKPIGFFSDVDGTLVRSKNNDPLSLPQTVSVLNQNRDKLAISLITGRSLLAVKEMAAKLKDIPVDFLGVNNGHELYINRHHEPTDQWIQRLNQQKDQDPGWLKLLKSKGWSHPMFMKTMVNVLQKEGFKPVPAGIKPPRFFELTNIMVKDLPESVMQQHGRPDEGEAKPQVYVEYFADQPNFILHGSLIKLAPVHSAYAQQIADKIQSELKRKKIGFEYYQVNHARLCNQFFIPPGVNKATLIDHIRSTYLKAKATIVAGDQRNDVEMLSMPGVLPILSGQSLSIEELRKMNPQTEHAPIECQIGLPLQKQIDKVDLKSGQNPFAMQKKSA